MGMYCICEVCDNGFFSVLAKKSRTVDDNSDNDDIMLPLRQRRLPSFIAIDDTTPAPKPSDAGFHLTIPTVSKTKVTNDLENIFMAFCHWAISRWLKHWVMSLHL